MKSKIPIESEDVPSPTMPCYIRRSQFKLPFKPAAPVIMIGPGTGFAPFRGFLQHRFIFFIIFKYHGSVRKWQKEEKLNVGETILFTGCRNRAVDYIYQEELEQYEKEGVLTKNFVAFSRDDPNKKVYVQHLLAEQKDLVWDCIKEGRNGNIYVCG